MQLAFGEDVHAGLLRTLACMPFGHTTPSYDDLTRRNGAQIVAFGRAHRRDCKVTDHQ